MTRFYASVYAISRAAAVVSALAVAYMLGHIALEIVLRTVFATSTFVLDEFVGYAVFIAVIFSLGYVLEHGDLIRVALVIERLPRRAQDLLTALAAGLSGAGALGLAWMFWLRAARAFSRGTVSTSIAAVPTWIPQGLMLLGLLVFALQLFAYGLRHLTGHPSSAPRGAPQMPPE